MPEPRCASRSASCPLGWGHEAAVGSSQLELIAKADGRGHVGHMQVAAGQPVMHVCKHDAGVSIETLGQPIVGVERNIIESAAAGTGLSARAAGISAGSVGILMITVVRRGQVEIRYDRVSYPRPIDLQNLVVGKGGIVDESQFIATDIVETRRQRPLWMSTLDLLITTQHPGRPQALPTQ